MKKKAKKVVVKGMMHEMPTGMMMKNSEMKKPLKLKKKGKK